MAVYQADALVIRTREYGESDRLLTLFAREKGKIQAVAKGVRKPKSRQRAGTQLFTYADFLLYRGRSLDTVNQVNPRESFPFLGNDLDRTLAASGIAELLDIASMPEQPQLELFALTLTAFFLLEHYDPILVQCAYALRLLTVLGYSPCLDKCVECGGDLNGERILFSLEAGGTVCRQCQGKSNGRWVRAGSIAFMRQIGRTEIRKLDRLRWSQWMQKEIFDLIEAYCTHKFERNLRSWSMGKKLTGYAGLESIDGKGEPVDERRTMDGTGEN